MLAHAHRLLAQGYVPVTARLAFDTVTSKKVPSYRQHWQRATATTALEFCDDCHNALCIVTGVSDVVVIDADGVKPKEVGHVADGLQEFQELAERHGLPEGTPVQVSGSGGRHYFFSLTKSIAAGLARSCNRAKVKIDGRPTSLDVRAEGGNVFCSPTSYVAGDATRSYTWERPLCHAQELPALPDWVIGILNDDSSPPPPSSLKRKLDSHVLALPQGFDRTIKRKMEHQTGNTIVSVYERTGGIDFTVADKTLPCTICGSVHTSNCYLCRVVIDSCVYWKNYSRSCRVKLVDYRQHPVLHRILETPTADDPIVLLLQARMSSVGRLLRVSGTAKTFYCFTGHHWTVVPDVAIQQELRLLSFEVLDHLCKGLAAEIADCRRNNRPHDEATQDLRQFKKAQLFVQKAGNVKAITESAKMLLWDEDLALKLDKDPDLLGVANGVLELRTGTLRDGRPDDHVSVALDQEYAAIPTPDIDDFVGSLFNGDAAVIDYLQRLLGYAITGHTSEQVWAIWTGSGSNGKSLLIAVLQRLLARVWVTMAREVIFDSGRRQTEGGPSPHLTPLIGKRIGVREEKHPDAVLNEEIVKAMTGESSITARDCHDRDYKTFVATHLPILVCNARPPIDVDDQAMLRRIIVVPFKNVYTSPDDHLRPYDASNPTHRLKDPDLASRLASPECQQQLLAWLVAGARRWFQQGLKGQPPLLRSELDCYVADNDGLTAFIRDNCTTQGDSPTVNAADFRQAFIADTGRKVRQEDLKKAMAKRGFSYTQLKKRGQVTRVFTGLSMVSEIPAFD